MGDERIPKSMLYSELVDGRRKRGRPTLRFKDVCKRDLKSLNVGTDKWEELANDCDKWRSSLYKSLKEKEKQFFKIVDEEFKVELVLFSFYLFFVASL